MSNNGISEFDLNGDGKLDTNEIKLANLRWEARRRMAWISLFSVIIVTLCLLFTVSPEKLKVLDETISWFYISMASIIASYLGFSTWASKK
ncbi:MAG: hypothetical protein H8D97_00720 [Proteobacteria bacterium]|nr:hypothetical protein [Pseudomonadota bacterium]